MSSPAVDQVAPAQQYQREWEGAGGSNADPDWRQAQAATELLNTQTVDKIIPLPCFECTLLLSMDDDNKMCFSVINTQIPEHVRQLYTRIFSVGT